MSTMNNNTPRITTALRVRPPAACEDVFVDVLQQASLLRAGGTIVGPCANYLFGCRSTQEIVFETAVKAHLEKFLKAQENISIIAFGSKYSGKTFTMFGPGVQFTDSAVFYGVYPRLATYLFSQFDASLFAGDNPQVKVDVSFIEIDGSQIKDLLKNTMLTQHSESHITGQTTEDVLRHLEYVQCYSARDMINCLHIALHNRQIQSTHVAVEVIMEQPFLQRDGQYRPVKNSALFVDVGSTLMEHPLYVHPVNHLPILIQEDEYVLSTLALTCGGRTTCNEARVPHENHLFNVLKESFSGERDSLVFCCISPSSVQYAATNNYLSDLSTINDMKSNFQLNTVESFDLSRNKNLSSNKANSLISEAESLLSRLSVTKSVTEEDQEKLKNWLHMKRECEDDSLNAQSHGQLECIEEVTESEEEIASSDEKMSESPDSLDNSLSESDQEEGNSKVGQLDNSNFLSSLNNMCVQFNTFVDKFVDSFKAKTSLSPAKERKRDYSAARRGGMPELPKVNDFQAQISSASSSLENFNQYSQQSESSSQGCIRKTKTAHHTHDKNTKTTSFKKGKEDRRVVREKELYFSDTSLDEEERETVTRRNQQSKELDAMPKDTRKTEEREKTPDTKKTGEEEKNPDDDEKYVTWSMIEPNILSDYELLKWMKRHEEDLKKIQDAWTAYMNKMISAEIQGKDGETKALEVERNKQMFYAVGGIDTFIDMIKDNLNLRSDFGVDESSLGFNHLIRWHRLRRQDFAKHKSNLDADIKNKRATDVEIRDYLMADEMIETLDSSIEFLNYMMLNNKPMEQRLPNTEVGKDVLENLKGLNSLEMRNLMFKYFMKVVDLRENSKQMENVIADYEQKLELQKTKINTLIRMIQNLRSQESQVQTMANYSPPEGAYGGRENPPSTLALPESSKPRRGPSIPQQNLSKLQVTKAAPPAKVTFTNKKLIIEKPNKH